MRFIFSMSMVVLCACGGGDAERLSDYTLRITPRVLEGQDPFGGGATVKLWLQEPEQEPMVTFLGGASGSPELGEQPPVAAGSTVALLVEDGGADDGGWSPTALQAWGGTTLSEALGSGTGEVALTVTVASSYEVGALDRLGNAKLTMKSGTAVLPSGEVLLFGGTSDQDSSGNETDRILRMGDINGDDWSFSTMSAKLPSARAGCSATTVEVGGKPLVFVAGGGLRSGETYSNEDHSTWAGLYDPDSDTFVWDKPRALSQGMSDHTAVRMANDNVLLVGRAPTFVNEVAAFELFDPDSERVVASGELEGLGAHGLMAASLGLDGALVCGGALISDANFDLPLEPQDGCVRIDLQGTVREAEALPTPTALGSMVGLSDGSVLLTGGLVTALNETITVAASSQAKLYASGTWSDVGPLEVPRSHHRSIPMHDGGAMLIGGAEESGLWRADNDVPVQCAERFDPAGKSFEQVGCNGAGSGAEPSVAWWPGRGAFVLEGWSTESGSAEGGALYGWVGMGPE